MERSFNGETFTQIATVAGQGNTSRPTNYAYTDAGVGVGRKGFFHYNSGQPREDFLFAFSPSEFSDFALCLTAHFSA
ncbi:hypothetical protein [Hymenobacter terrenus]|uniref:hypothetical protein n=1 Tax=Hymenobacter terrenus TaxID=1629124 RepID=UPI000619D143|nr:hypothetical protein [Hymenobacter terrenus]